MAIVKNQDIPGAASPKGIMPITLCITIAELFGASKVVGAKCINGLWRVYVQSIERTETAH